MYGYLQDESDDRGPEVDGLLRRRRGAVVGGSGARHILEDQRQMALARREVLVNPLEELIENEAAGRRRVYEEDLHQTPDELLQFEQMRFGRVLVALAQLHRARLHHGAVEAGEFQELRVVAAAAAEAETSEAGTMTTAVAKPTDTPTVAAAAATAATVASVAAPAATETSSAAAASEAVPEDGAAASVEAAPQVAETLPNGVLETRVVTHKYEGNDEDELFLDVGQVVNILKLEVRTDFVTQFAQ